MLLQQLISVFKAIRVVRAIRNIKKDVAAKLKRIVIWYHIFIFYKDSILPGGRLIPRYCIF